MKYYRVAFYPRNNPRNKDHGKLFSDKSIAQAWVDQGNRDFPEIFHFLEEMEVDEKNTAQNPI